MGQKYAVYVDLNSKEKYFDWAECAELKKKGGTNFKGFMSEEEADAYMNGGVSKDSNFSEEPIEETQETNDEVVEDNDQEFAPEVLLDNLNTCMKNCECSEEQKQVLQGILESVKLNEDYDLGGLNVCLEEIWETHNNVDAVIFVDGSAKDEKLGIGLLFFDVKEKSIQAYDYRISKDTKEDLDWILKGSNDSAEIIAAIFSMWLSKKNGCKKIRIYQDNTRALSYLYNYKNFKNLNNEVGAWFLEEIKNYVKNMDARFIYVPAHSKKDGYDDIGKNAFLKKLTFPTAKQLNAEVDKLAKKGTIGNI